MTSFISSSAHSAWTKQQTDYLRMRFASHIRRKKVIGKMEAEEVIQSAPKLCSHRTWQSNKYKVSFFFCAHDFIFAQLHVVSLI